MHLKGMERREVVLTGHCFRRTTVQVMRRRSLVRKASWSTTIGGSGARVFGGVGVGGRGVDFGEVEVRTRSREILTGLTSIYDMHN